MPQNAAFHQGLALFEKNLRSSVKYKKYYMKLQPMGVPLVGLAHFISYSVVTASL